MFIYKIKNNNKNLLLFFHRNYMSVLPLTLPGDLSLVTITDLLDQRLLPHAIARCSLKSLYSQDCQIYTRCRGSKVFI